MLEVHALLGKVLARKAGGAGKSSVGTSGNAREYNWRFCGTTFSTPALTFTLQVATPY